MEVSNVLDAYTIAYGWTVYRLFFIFLIVIGAPLYPVAVLLSDLAGGYAERGGDPLQLIKAAFFRCIIWFVVVFSAFLPLVPLNMEVAKVRNACGTFEITQNENIPDQKFQFEESRVPIAPWAAMQLASGLKAVINTLLPCVEDITSTNQALRQLDISKADDPAKLNTEQNRFSNECFIPSVQHYQRTIRGYYGQDAADRMRQLSQDYQDTNQTNKEMILSLPSSSFLREYFYQKPSLCSGLVETDAMYFYCLGLPIKAQGPVDQINSADTSLLSEYQKSINESIPTCSEWFDTPDIGLRDRLYAASENKLLDSTAYALANFNSGNNAGFLSNLPGAQKVQLIKEFVGNIVGGGEEGYRNFMVDRLYTNAAQSNGNLLSDQNRSTLNTIAGAGAIGTIAGIFNLDLAESIGQDAVSFYTSAMIYRIAASFFHPLLLMAVFMFWGIYLIIAEMRGKAMMQGLIIIFILSIIPGIWAIGNHLDDKLYVAMFPQTASWADILKSPADHLERLMLDIVSTVFYIILPLILIYVAVMAGSATQTVNAFSNSVSGPSKSGGSNVGTSSARNTGKQFTRIKSKLSNLRTKK